MGLFWVLIPARSTFTLPWNCTHVLLLYVLFWIWRRCHFCFLSLPKTSNKQHCLYGNALSFQEQVLPQLAEIHLETGGEEGTNYTNTSCSEARHASCIFWYSATMFTGGLFFLIPSESVCLKADFLKSKIARAKLFKSKRHLSSLGTKTLAALYDSQDSHLVPLVIPSSSRWGINKHLRLSSSCLWKSGAVPDIQNLCERRMPTFSYWDIIVTLSRAAGGHFQPCRYNCIFCLNSILDLINKYHWGIRKVSSTIREPGCGHGGWCQLGNRAMLRCWRLAEGAGKAFRDKTGKHQCGTWETGLR